ncbi:hypothetical protein GCM10009541_50320 [Micromonospora gifhornensis]|uniref:Uncharacterized protein n=1 Tax=Micromonospora gifhornensis TaxID=84594 RepID=A0ABQ4ILD2_9ACTN|nr:hypothetical protein [Micromonospora gifhornensis]GIJ18513.1 hypothetical protein Vgi01_51970 [Micromonospora gifhornensis]
MKAAGMNESQYAQAPQAHPDSDFLATARVVLDIHRDDDGFCLGCHVYFRQLKPFPCEYHSWAARVIATYPRAAPSAGRASARNRRPAPLRLVQPATTSACDDTVVLRMR